MMHSVIDSAPPELVHDIFLDKGVLYYSDARNGDPVFLSFLSLARKSGVTKKESIPASEFNKFYQKHVNTIDTPKNYNTFEEAIKLFQDAFDKHATDIHLIDRGSHGIIKFRCFGMLREDSRIPGKRIQSLMSVIYGSLCDNQTTTSFTIKQRQDARISKRAFLPKDVNSVRLHTEPIAAPDATDGIGCFMALRLLYDRTDAKGTLEERLAALGYEAEDIERFRELTERTGLTFIGGPVNSGKSTTLKHLMESQAREHPEKSFFSNEDPPEYPLENIIQAIVSTDLSELGNEEKRRRNHSESIGGILRSDQNVVMVGETRYRETLLAIIELAQTGSSLFTSFHADSALGIVLRAETMLEGSELRAPLKFLCNHNILSGLVFQRLVPRLCPHCKMPLMSSDTQKDTLYIAEILPEHIYKQLERVVDDLSFVHIRGKGCSHCDYLGISGQTVVAEVIVTDDVLLRHLRHGDYDKAYAYWRTVLKGRSYIQHAIDGISKGMLDPYLTKQALGVPLTSSRSAGEAGEQA